MIASAATLILPRSARQQWRPGCPKCTMARLADSSTRRRRRAAERSDIKFLCRGGNAGVCRVRYYRRLNNRVGGGGGEVRGGGGAEFMAPVRLSFASARASCNSWRKNTLPAKRAGRLIKRIPDSKLTQMWRRDRQATGWRAGGKGGGRGFNQVE